MNLYSIIQTSKELVDVEKALIYECLLVVYCLSCCSSNHGVNFILLCPDLGTFAGLKSPTERLLVPTIVFKKVTSQLDLFHLWNTGLRWRLIMVESVLTRFEDLHLFCLVVHLVFQSTGNREVIECPIESNLAIFIIALVSHCYAL